MDRRELLVGLAFALTCEKHSWALAELADKGPRDTDDPIYDEILDEMLGEEWS